MGAAGLSGAAAGMMAAGPVAGFILAAYGVLGTRAAVRRAARQRAAAARSRGLDQLTALAADLRAGLAMCGSSTAGVPHASPGDRRLAALAAAVWRLAERTGAPAADLVERIEADARADDRSRATAAAQAAGAQATSLLLTALPLGGIGLGYSVGVDPLQVLLHTPLGAACAVGAVLLQSAGLLWADRLANGPAR
jgi:tight adherence protein B